MPLRVSLIFQVATEAADRNAASPHTGGWSESHWLPSINEYSLVTMREIANTRASFLPKQVDIIGWRNANYTLSGNKLLPQGTSVVKMRFPGAANWTVDVPQAALVCGASIAARTNGTRFSARGIADEMVVKGEYQPTDAYSRNVTEFFNALLGISPPGEGGWPVWGAIVRDLTLPSFRVLRISLGQIELDQPAGIGVNDYIRLRRVKGTDGKPISGAFRVTAAPGGGLFTVAGLPTGATANEGGFGRKDAVVFGAYSGIQPVRVGVRKIGGPSEKYRGRRSRRR